MLTWIAELVLSHVIESLARRMGVAAPIKSTTTKYVVTLTQAEYDALSPDPNTLYLIV